jgi:gas vesicle structural protein
MQHVGGSVLERRQETSSLADVVGTILDKGVVIDVFARVSVVGIEVLRVDARVVVASIDTYLRFAEAANRLQLGMREPRQLPDLARDIAEGGARGIAAGKAKGIAEAKAKAVEDVVDASLDRLERVLSPGPAPRRSPRSR